MAAPANVNCGIKGGGSEGVSRLTVHIGRLSGSPLDRAATEAAIVNALLAAETMIGRDGITAHALTAERLLDAIERVRRG